MLLESDRIIVYGRKSTESIVTHSIEIGIISLQWLCVVVVMDWIVWIGLYGLDCMDWIVWIGWMCGCVCRVGVGVGIGPNTNNSNHFLFFTTTYTALVECVEFRKYGGSLLVGNPKITKSPRNHEH
jgi:hypothetical protein